MRDFKGTPAPWDKLMTKKGDIAVRAKRLYPNRDLYELNVITGHVSDDDCSNKDCCNVVQHANANLIAAAPKIFEALKKLLHLHSCEMEGLSSGQPTSADWMKAYDNGVSAILKAVGEGEGNG